MHKMLSVFLIAAPAMLLSAAASAQIAQPPAVSDDCQAAHPPVAGSGNGAAQEPGATGQADTLTDQLATCGSVLNPPRVGDPDVVQPAPAIDDPMAIHPQDPQQIPQ